MIMNKCNICGIPHQIVEVEDVFDEDGSHFGQIDYKTATIKICKDMTADIKDMTLFHEIVHGILVHIGEFELTQDEKFVQNLSLAIRDTFSLKQY